MSLLPLMLISSSGYEERLSEEKVTEERRKTPSCALIREAPPKELEEFVRFPSNATFIKESDTRAPSLALEDETLMSGCAEDPGFSI